MVPLPFFELFTASSLLARLGQIAIGYLRVDPCVVQGTCDHRESDGPRCRTIGFRVLEVIALVCGDHSDQQPDEHNDAENSTTPHAASIRVLRQELARSSGLPGGQFVQTFRQLRNGHERGAAARAGGSQSLMALTSTVRFSRLTISCPSSSNARSSTLRPSPRNASYICCDSEGGTLVSLRP